MPTTYNPATLKYFDDTGAEVNPRTILDANTAASKERLKSYTNDFKPIASKYLEAGISREEYLRELRGFRNNVAAEIKGTRLACAVVGAGGVEQMNPSHFGRTGQVLRQDYDDLNGLIADLTLEPEIAIGDGDRMALEQRLQLYANRNAQLFEATRVTTARTNGIGQMWNVLEPTAKHCGDCLNMTRLSPMPVDSPLWVPHALRECGNCQCGVEFG